MKHIHCPQDRGFKLSLPSTSLNFYTRHFGNKNNRRQPTIWTHTFVSAGSLPSAIGFALVRSCGPSPPYTLCTTRCEPPHRGTWSRCVGTGAHKVRVFKSTAQGLLSAKCGVFSSFRTCLCGNSSECHWMSQNSVLRRAVDWPSL